MTIIIVYYIKLFLLLTLVKTETRRNESFTRPGTYNSSLEANNKHKNSLRNSPIPIREARIVNTVSPKMSPVNKSFIPPRTPIVSEATSTMTNKYKSLSYDEKKNPFANDEDEEQDDDENNPFNPFNSDKMKEDDYNKNLNPFAS